MDPAAAYPQPWTLLLRTPKPWTLLLRTPKTWTLLHQVWVKPELRADGLMYWQADSDSQLTKGLAALLVLGLSGVCVGGAGGLSGVGGMQRGEGACHCPS